MSIERPNIYSHEEDARKRQCIGPPEYGELSGDARLCVANGCVGWMPQDEHKGVCIFLSSVCFLRQAE